MAEQQMGPLFWFLLMVETKRGYGLRRGHCFCLYLVVVVVLLLRYTPYPIPCFFFFFGLFGRKFALFRNTLIIETQHDASSCNKIVMVWCVCCRLAS